MKHFLIAYARRTGTLLRFQEYADSGEALTERFRLERVYIGPDVEVVVLSAESEAVIRRTHGRYFQREAAHLTVTTQETETR